MDTEGLLKLLNENRVDFVIIGATAFPVHGYARATLEKERKGKNKKSQKKEK